jgi:hypothetical protein
MQFFSTVRQMKICPKAFFSAEIEIHKMDTWLRGSGPWLGCLDTALTTRPGGIWMTAAEDPTWAMVAAVEPRTSSSKVPPLPSLDLAGEAHEVYFGGASSFGFTSTSKLLQKNNHFKNLTFIFKLTR